MKRFLLFLGLFLPLCLRAATPAFTDFNTSQFSTTANKVTVKSGATLTNLVFGAGSVGTPSMQLGTTISGWYGPANNIRGTIGGVDRFRLDASGIIIDETSQFRWASDLSTPTITTRIITGNGTPEGGNTAGPGSIYLRKDGAAGTSIYIKESGTGNTGWVAYSGTGGGASDNWVASGTTNSLLYGRAFMDSQVTTNGATFGVVNHTALDTITLSGIGSTPTDGLVLTNSSVATVGAQQYSPALHLGGSGWKTTITAAAQPVDWRIYTQPVQGAANPTANLLFDASINGGAYATKATITSGGNIIGTLQDTTLASSYGLDASARVITSSLGYAMASGALLYWNSGDVGISRTAAGVLSFFDSSLSPRTGWMQWRGQSRVATQYDQTTTTLGNVTGLTSTVIAGRTYKFVAHLDCTLDVTGGGKYAMGGTATATSISYRVRHVGASLAMLSSTRQTALASAVNSAASLTDDDVEIIGLITVANAGTITAQFAQQAAGGTSSVLVGSWLELMDVQ